MSRHEDFLSYCATQHVTLNSWQRVAAENFLNDRRVSLTESRNPRRSGKTFLAVRLLEFDSDIHVWVQDQIRRYNYPPNLRDQVRTINPSRPSVGYWHRKVIYDDFPLDAEISSMSHMADKLLILRDSNFFPTMGAMPEISTPIFSDGYASYEIKVQKDWDD